MIDKNKEVALNTLGAITTGDCSNCTQYHRTTVKYVTAHLTFIENGMGFNDGMWLCSNCLRDLKKYKNVVCRFTGDELLVEYYKDLLGENNEK